MSERKFENAVYLDPEKCKGCTNCIKRCPTGAIRVRDGKATINKAFCIDCGECIRICQHHAKIADRDEIARMKDYEYTIALPAPSLYGQFNNLEDPNILLTALRLLGFDFVFEVASGAETVSRMTRKYLAEHRDQLPLISTACPSVVRLIRIRFPNLIDHLLPLRAPVEISASIARQCAIEETGLPSEKIGVFFISPCPAKVSACRSPLGYDKSDVDAVLAIKDIYPMLLPHMQKAAENPEMLAAAGKIGVGWGISGGEADGLTTEHYLAADGIENVLGVLEDLEDQKLPGLEFIELDACNGGCVGGVLTVENPYVSETKLKLLNKHLPRSKTHRLREDIGYWTEEVEYEPVYKLGKTLKESFELMARADELEKHFPGIDCGSCGAPSCRALAEDIVRGQAQESDCIHLLRRSLMDMDMDLAEMLHKDLKRAMEDKK